MNSMTTYIITLIINIGYTHLLLTRKRSIKSASFIFIINYLIALLVYSIACKLFKDTVFYPYMPYIAGFIFIIYIFLVFKESISKNIFTMFIIWIFSVIIVIMCTYIVRLFAIKDFRLSKTYITLLKDFIQLIFIPIIYLYFQNPYKKMLNLISNKMINIVSFYIIIIFLFLINYYQVYYYKYINYYGLFNSVLMIIIVILSYIIIFISISSSNRNMELEYKLKIIDTQLELQKQNYKTLNKSLEDYYAFKHDVRHHVLAIEAIMDTNNYAAASEYLNEFKKDKMYQDIDILCQNFTIDSILKHYRSIGKNNNIEFNVDVNIPQDITIDNLDLCIVIGNCVENAIEACNNVIDKNKKYINIKCELKGSHILIKIKNSFNGQVTRESSIIKTSKNGEGHGIGLSNVKKIAEKYNGYFNIKYDDSEFNVYIVMNYITKS